MELGKFCPQFEGVLGGIATLLVFLGKLLSTCFRRIMSPHGFSERERRPCVRRLTSLHSGIFGPVHTGSDYAVKYFSVLLFLFSSLLSVRRPGALLVSMTSFGCCGQSWVPLAEASTRTPSCSVECERFCQYGKTSHLGTSLGGFSEERALPGLCSTESCATSRRTVVQVPI